MIPPARYVCVALCLLVARDDKPDALAGKWNVVASVADGKAVPEASLQGRSLAFDGKEMAAHSADRKLTMNYTCDRSKMPHEIDISSPDGSGKTMRGIFSVDGDTLKLCYGGEGIARPATFASEPGSKCYFLTLKREARK